MEMAGARKSYQRLKPIGAEDDRIFIRHIAVLDERSYQRLKPIGAED